MKTIITIMIIIIIITIIIIIIITVTTTTKLDLMKVGKIFGNSDLIVPGFTAASICIASKSADA